MTLKRSLLLAALLGQCACSLAQHLTGAALLTKSIAYHDPGNQWPAFKGTLLLTETRPGGKDRITSIYLDNRKGCFRMDQTRGNDQIVRSVKKGRCSHSLNGSRKITLEKQEAHRLTCKRTQFMSNYYTYLWGLPMKLRDKGTIIHDEVEQTVFHGKDYLRLKVTYAAAVGKDTWYFYFDPVSYALRIYQFYHDESKNDGEYIILNEEVKVGTMRLPKTRKWYVNKDDTFLGADILEK